MGRSGNVIRKSGGSARAKSPTGFSQTKLEALVRLHKAVPLIETMSIVPLSIAGQLNPIAAKNSRLSDRTFEEKASDAPSSPLRMDVDRLNLCTQASLGLEMAKHDELAYTHDNTVDFGR
jgi:hypothetical protein